MKNNIHIYDAINDISISWVITETIGGPESSNIAVSRQRNEPLESPLKANMYQKLVHKDNKNLRFVLLALKEGRKGAGRRRDSFIWAAENVQRCL